MAIHATPSCRKPRLHSHPVPYCFACALTGTCFDISWEREPSGIASNNNGSAAHSRLNLLWFIRGSSKLRHLMERDVQNKRNVGCKRRADVQPNTNVYF